MDAIATTVRQLSSRKLVGRTAIVTGSTSGIGLGIARALAQAGANIVLNGLDKIGAEATRRALADKYGVDVHFDEADLTNGGAAAAMVGRAERDFGAVDILVNNAGIQFVSPIEDFPAERWDAILSLNLSAVFHASKAAFRSMKQRRFGRIINIASAHGLVA